MTGGLDSRAVVTSMWPRPQLAHRGQPDVFGQSPPWRLPASDEAVERLDQQRMIEATGAAPAQSENSSFPEPCAQWLPRVGG